jgi:fumarylacetoacetase
LDALRPFAAPSPPRDGPVAPYLKDPSSMGTYTVELRAEVIVDGTSTRTCTAKLEWMYWSFRHIFAHQCIGGCGVSSGDIIATGTASGTTPDSLGCLLEMTVGGRNAFELNGGLKRTWLEDGDSVRITGFAGTEADGVGFGECIGKVVPARMLKG